MRIPKPRNIGIVFLHIVFWVFYILFMHVITVIQEPGVIHTKGYVTVTRYTLASIVFYTSAYVVFPFCFKTPKHIRYLIIVLPAFILFNFGLRRLVIGTVVPFVMNVPKPEARIFEYFILSLKWWFDYSLFGLGFWYARKLVTTQRLLRITEKARLEAEFNHLRAQINPHFLFNTLNTFYSQSLKLLPDTAKGISLLSKIMRYSLEPSGRDGKVSLESEMAHANHYIELMNVRFPGHINISNNMPDEIDNRWQILPHVLITLVENAFKHGNRDHPFIFDIQLTGGQIIFKVENTIGEKPAEISTGVGLRNLEERLQLTYGKKYTFMHCAKDGKYNSLLIIPDAFDNYMPVKKEPQNTEITV
jgi:two-component system, LytTR family, sensor kinase